MKKVCLHIVSLLVLLHFAPTGAGKLTVSGQIRTRTELRDGAGTLRLKANSPSFFISQRIRIAINYKASHVTLYTALQDVRAWGQDASTIYNANGNKLLLHEGWVEIALSDRNDTSFNHSSVDYFAIKSGRLELVYDDSRLLGNLVWLQQARRHDAVGLKFLNKGWQLEIGAAFNQKADAFGYNRTYYTPANVPPYVKDSKGNLAPTPIAFIPLSTAEGLSSKTGVPAVQSIASSNGLYQNYKSLQYAYLAKTAHQTKLSGLLLADHSGKYKNDSVRNIAGSDTGYI
jgi:hypothetical protein